MTEEELLYTLMAGLANGGGGAQPQVVNNQEAAAEMALNHMQAARSLMAGAGYDPDYAISGASAIDSSGLSFSPGLFTRGPRPATPAPTGRTLNLSPALLRGMIQGGVRRMADIQAGRPVTFAPAQPEVRPVEPGGVDYSYVGFESLGVPANTAVTIPVSSQTIFKPHRLNVPRSLADFFVINSFFVGNVPLAAAAGNVPASSFATDATGANVRKETANPGVQIILQVSNIDGVAHDFRATLFGESAQPDGCRR